MELTSLFPKEQLGLGLLERVSRASDASVYSILPQGVVWPRSTDEVLRLLAWCRESRVPVTFRAGGTSLSGQSVGPGIICDLSRAWGDAVVLEGGHAVRVQPGIVGAHVNGLLAPWGRKIGPDPASISAAMMGGILANNSSGMCCGVARNAYHTIRGMKLVLADGLVVDTMAPGARERFRQEAPRLAEGLLKLREQVVTTPSLAERIRRKYRYKNTTGYGLNSLIDYSDPLDILTHIMIGSEGTLGFIAEATLETVPACPHALTGILFFDDPVAACAAIIPLRDAGAEAIELMDRASLRSVEDLKGSPALLKGLPPDATGLLVEFQAQTSEELALFRERAQHLAHRLKPGALLPFTENKAEQEALWKLRKGTFPAVGATRPSGTSVIIEDVLFPLETLAQGVGDLRKLFERHGYHDAILFGHAKDGNLHFVISQAFEDPREVKRYDAFLREMVDLVTVRHEGALKAEHGTGRNMAPFIASEWGDDGLAIMKKLKALLDPDGILNPGVIVNAPSDAHVRSLKDIPTAAPAIDKCIECGYCAPTCPSEKYTLSPRDRIVIFREMARLGRQNGQPGWHPFSPATALRELRGAFAFKGVATCATDGLCATACPVGINTGQFVKELRAEHRSGLGLFLADAARDRMRIVETLFRWSLSAGHAIARLAPSSLLEGAVRLVRRLTGLPLPFWHSSMPLPAPAIRPRPLAAAERSAVLFPTCVNRVMGADARHAQAGATRSDELVELARRAGVALRLPEKSAGQCCGMPFFSKGFPEQGLLALGSLVDAMWLWSDEGRLPVVVDNSPCTHSVLEHASELPEEQRERFARLKLMDIIEFVHDIIMPHLSLSPLDREVYVYPVCSVTKMGLTPKLKAIAERCATDVRMPERPACCGQAGDRGFYYPELTAAAAAKIAWNKPPVDSKKPQRHECACATGQSPTLSHFSTSRTCEANLGRNSGEVYTSVVSLVLESSHSPRRSE